MNKITEDEWLQIIGLITLGRENKKQQLDIESVIERKFNFIDGYFTDEVWGDLSLNAIRKKWLGNNLIDMKIIKKASQKLSEVAEN